VRSRGASRCTASVVINGQTVVNSGSNLPSGWTEIVGFYDSDPAVPVPIVEVVVSCPPRSNKMKRQDDGGLDIDDLNMNEADLSSIATQSMSSTFGPVAEISSDAALLPQSSSPIAQPSSSTSADNSPAGSNFSPLSPSESMGVASPTSSDTSSPTAILESSSTTPLSSVIDSGASTITSSASLPDLTVSSTTSASASSSAILSCDPVILDPGFEISGEFQTMDDWQFGDSADVNDPRYIFDHPSDAINGGALDNYGFGLWTRSIQNETKDITYLHPIKLCKGIEYQIGLWARSHIIRRTISAGCRISAVLGNKTVWTDRIGVFDRDFRYIGFPVSFSEDTIASFKISVTCELDLNVSPTITQTRGVILDNIVIRTAAGFVSPTSAERPTYAADFTIQPIQSAPCCTPTPITKRVTCVQPGNLIVDPSFEGKCDDSMGIPTGSDLGLLYEHSGWTTEEAHTGPQSIKFTFGPGGGNVVMRPGQDSGMCPERNFKYSYWMKTTVPGACQVETVIGPRTGGGKVVGVLDAGNGAWTKAEDTLVNSYYIATGFMSLRIVCYQAATVYIDDISFEILPGWFNVDPTVTILSSLPTPTPIYAPEQCVGKVDDPSFEQWGNTGNSGNWTYGGEGSIDASTNWGVSQRAAISGYWGFELVSHVAGFVARKLLAVNGTTKVCPGEYHFGAMAKVFQTGGKAYEGCQVTAYAETYVFTATIGHADTDARWMGGTVTFTSPATVTPYFIMNCPTAQRALETGTRGIL
jgi:hypothetical protein